MSDRSGYQVIGRAGSGASGEQEIRRIEIRHCGVGLLLCEVPTPPKQLPFSVVLRRMNRLRRPEVRYVARVSPPISLIKICVNLC